MPTERMKISEIKPKLKPCPFCGCEITVERKGWFRSDTIIDQYKLVGKHKDGCIFSELSWMGGYETQDEAIEAWNRRMEQ